MGEMKSAFERALEKVDKLGKLSPEEMREREEEEMVTRRLIWIGLIALLVSACAAGKSSWGV